MSGKDRTYISVILPLRLDWIPCYGVPEGEEVLPGDWVRVDFAGREYLGTVDKTGIVPDTEQARIKDIVSAERRLWPVSEKERRLWEAVADYYLCSTGEVFKAAYPAMKISQAEALARMQERENTRKERLSESLMLKIQKTEDMIRKKKQMLSEKRDRPAGKGKSCEILEASIARLEEKAGQLRLKIEETRHGCRPERHLFQDAAITLTEYQQKTYMEALEGFREHKPVLIKGVTGSGKTEIYLRAAMETLSQGKNVLYLVPEIAVSRQLKDRIQSVFGDILLTFHSEESNAARRDTAEKIRKSGTEGSQYFVLGTRSAIFLPHTRLGLIIVDEEHDSSYKQSSPAPRYNGRDVAVMLAKIHGADILLGSATPSLESVFNGHCGKYRMLTLGKRYYKADEAETEIIDTAAERRKNGMAGSFSRKLADRIRETLECGEQVLILRARRAFSPVMQCPSCGYIPKCPHCNVSLSLHKSPDRMVCHHCGYTTAFRPECPECGTALYGIGSGTQKIEEEAASLFPGARIARLDSDTPKTLAAETIKGFGTGSIDILIGTQIISKGFDFPGLTLTAVISADSLLGVQDFRADEKAMQALEQLRGRCGRRDKRGRFIIQTCRPGHPVYRQLADGSSDLLYETLLLERKEFGYPPFTRIVNVAVKDPSLQKAEDMSARLASILEQTFGNNYPEQMNIETVSGPFSPPVDRVAGYNIRIIRLTLKKDRNLHDAKRRLSATVAAFERQYRYAGHITLDVDPD